MTFSSYHGWDPDAESASWTAGDGFLSGPQEFLHPVDARGHRLAGYQTDGQALHDGSGNPSEVLTDHFLFDHELTQLLSDAAQEIDHRPPAGTPAVTVAAAPSRHRRQRPVSRVARRLGRAPAVPVVLLLVSAALTLAVSAIGGAVSYRPLQQLAFPTTGALSTWWPVLIYGPWLVGVLSVLRTPTSRRIYRRAGWSVVITFSALAGALCVAGWRTPSPAWPRRPCHRWPQWPVFPSWPRS